MPYRWNDQIWSEVSNVTIQADGAEKKYLICQSNKYYIIERHIEKELGASKKFNNNKLRQKHIQGEVQGKRAL